MGSRSQVASPKRLIAEAKTTFFRSYDVIEIVERSDSCGVTYDATLELNGPLGLLDFGLRRFLGKIGDKPQQEWSPHPMAPRSDEKSRLALDQDAE